MRGLKVVVICDNCNKEVELLPENKYNVCNINNKLSQGGMLFEYDAEAQITDRIEDIREYDETYEISTEVEMRSMRFTCDHCNNYIEFQIY